MSGPDAVDGVAPSPTSRGRWLVVARIAFLVAAIGFGWLWLRDDWDDVVAAFASVGPASWARALIEVLLGLLITGFVWTLGLRRFGHDVPTGAALSVFFVGQLGKYIPGSVWSLGAQAQMATRYGVPPRTTVVAGLVFLGWNVVTAVLVTAVGALRGYVDLPVSTWVLVLAAVAALVCLTLPVVNAAGSWAAGEGRRLALSWRDCILVAVALTVTWLLYGMALYAVSPGLSNSEYYYPREYGPGAATVAFTAAYAVGVLVVLAPAGLGAREAILTLLLTPFLGVAGAAAAALLTRVVHTVADFFMAGAAWVLGRGSAHATPPE